MRKAIIHGANRAGQMLYMRLNYVFDICAFIDRKAAFIGKDFEDVPIYCNYSESNVKNIDFIFVASEDYDGILLEYDNIFKNEHNKPKIISLLRGYQMHRIRHFFGLANEIYRKNIPGAVAELGVDQGDTARYINLIFGNRKLYLFDTFSGFAEEDLIYERSQRKVNETALAKYSSEVNIEEIIMKMFYPEQCVIKKGRFPESLNGLDDTFAFVHLDCDLIVPIRDALEYFYPRLSDGGYICVHDYNNPNYTGVCKTFREFADANSTYIVQLPDCDSAVITKC